MRVLYISGMYPNPTFPQKGIFCHEQVKALKKLGVGVDVVVPITVYEKEVKQKTWTYEGVDIRYVRFFKLPGTRDFHRTGNNLFFSLDRSVDLKEYDLYHADAPLPAGHAAMIASKKYGKPFIVHGHGLDVFYETDYGKQKNYCEILKRAVIVYNTCDMIVGVSQKVINNILTKCPVQNKCRVIYNGVNIERFYPEDRIFNEEPLRILSIGNLIDIKGHDLLIKAAAEILRKEPESVVVDIYGRGENESELRALADSLGIADHVCFNGYVRNEELGDIYRSHDAFILPSWYEALGCVYMEAMACGLITVGCYDNGIDEIINSGKNGFLIRPRSLDEIVDVIIKIRHLSADNKDSIRQSSIESIRDNYSWNHSAETLKEIYSTLCAK